MQTNGEALTIAERARAQAGAAGENSTSTHKLAHQRALVMNTRMSAFPRSHSSSSLWRCHRCFFLRL